jgi:hypothetical protein
VTDRDDELRARLRAADPASTLPPADPAGMARLLEDTMSHDVMDESRETGTRDRSPLTWLVAAAAVVVIAVAGGFLLVNGEDSADPVAGEGADPTVTDLRAPAAAAGRCMVPTAERLATAPVAFDGVVTEQTDGLVTLEPSRWYAGDPTDLVTVTAPDRDLALLLTSVEFEEGGRYLVAATGGAVMICGFSGPHSGELADLYAEAFGG